jgi:hypothetical protein
MTVLRGGVGDIWHMYQKDTGKGRNVIVRKAHSAQSSPKLKAWQNTVRMAAISGFVTQAAKEACEQYADKLPPQARMRFYRDPSIKRCKMTALRAFMAFALKWVAEHRSEVASFATMSAEDIKKKKSEIVDYILNRYGRPETATATAAAAGGKTSEVRGVWF